MKKDSNKNSSQEIKLATALSYDAGRDNAQSSRHRQDEIAERSLRGKRGKVPVYKDQSLAQSLVHLSLGSEIPVELYDVVAQVLAFIGRMEDYYDRGSKYE